MKKAITYLIAGVALAGTLFFMKTQVDKFEENAKPGTFEVGIEGNKKDDKMKEDMDENMKEDMDENMKENMDENMKEDMDENMKEDMDENMKEDMDENMKEDMDEKMKEDMDEDKKEDNMEEYNQIANFTLNNLDGEEISLSDYQGKKIFLNFWATWCPNCREEMPHMVEIAENFKDEIVIIAVNVGEDKETVKKYADNAGLTFEVLLDQKNEVAGKYGVTGFPTSVLLDENGNPIYGQTGRMTYEQMEEFIKGE